MAGATIDGCSHVAGPGHQLTLQACDKQDVPRLLRSTALSLVNHEVAFSDRADAQRSQHDPSLVSDPDHLVVLHYNENAHQWENLGGIVDTVSRTISIETTSLSPFGMAVVVPEPSSRVLAATGLIGVPSLVRRRVACRGHKRLRILGATQRSGWGPWPGGWKRFSRLSSPREREQVGETARTTSLPVPRAWHSRVDWLVKQPHSV